MKQYLIIGGSSGIGKALANQLAQEGHRVTATFHKNKRSAPNIAYHYLDVTDTAPDFTFMPSVIDGLVYCPGSIQLKPFHRIKPEAFVADFNLQVVGAIRVIQAALPSLKAAPSASVVLFSTVAVQNGFNFHTQVATSKGAIEGLVRSLAAELAPSIRVNGIAPSLTDTPLAAKLLSNEDKRTANAKRHPLQRIGTPEDIASYAAFLLSEKGSWITGQIAHIDGGMSALRG